MLYIIIFIIRFIGNEGLPDILHDSAGDPLSPKPNNNRVAKPIFASQKNNRKDGGGGGLKAGMEAVRMSMLNGSSLGSSYDRSHITGTVPLGLEKRKLCNYSKIAIRRNYKYIS